MSERAGRGPGPRGGGGAQIGDDGKAGGAGVKSKRSGVCGGGAGNRQASRASAPARQLMMMMLASTGDGKLSHLVSPSPSITATKIDAIRERN